MTKPLVYVKTQVKVDTNPEPIDSWELLAFGGCPIMHAAYNPVTQGLVCQFSSVKENYIDVPKANAKGQVKFQTQKAEQYYRVVVTDKDAIEHILSTYVSNYAGQNWNVVYEKPEVEELVKAEV